MKLKNIEATGHCGIEIRLNLMDQFEATHLVNQYANIQSRMDEYKAYCNLSYDERTKYAQEHGKELRPQAPKIEELEEITERVMRFMRKLVLPDEAKADIFSE